MSARAPEVYAAIAQSLRDFGYADVTTKMIGEVDAAIQRRDSEMPYGVVALFAKRQLDEARKQGLLA